jgi:hypothetical protein
MIEDLSRAALELRAAGWSVNDIALELGIARSTAWLWVRHLPLDRGSERARFKAAEGREKTQAYWVSRRAARDQLRAATGDRVETHLGDLSSRDVFLLGAVAYWCEGMKAKPWRPNDCRLVFVNSDPMLVELFLRFLEGAGRNRRSLTYRLSIHERADHAAATRWWAERLDLCAEDFRRPSLKRHQPTTNRRNTGESYHGCLMVVVPRSRELYWQIEGAMRWLEGQLLAESPRRLHEAGATLT